MTSIPKPTIIFIRQNMHIISLIAMHLWLIFHMPLCRAAEQQLNHLTLDEKVGQMLMVHFTGEVANEASERLQKQAHVGSFIYYQWCNGLCCPEQVKQLSQSLQAHSPKVPLIIAIDQEGGRVLRLNRGFSTAPSNRILAQNGSLAEISAWAERVGLELSAVGINMNLAPVVDVDSNPNNPIIGNRSYSSDPHVVTQCGKAALEGYRRANVIAVLKHFPGHGDTHSDSHLSLPHIYKKRSELDAVELFPFKMLSHDTMAIMTAHLMIPALDPIWCASLSAKCIDGLLRQEYGYDGLVLSDSLAMQGALEQCQNVAEAAIYAIEAGTDIVILGGRQLSTSLHSELSVDDVIDVHHTIVRAVVAGQISEKRIDQSVERILKAKAWLR